jgi:flavin-dependent thymidylate synthase
MRIILAGYNLDSSVIEGLRAGGPRPELLTPETVAVAYARISRDPSPVTELREKAVADVEAARRSARSIGFAMNHQSVAEHATFNFDILEVSRLCVETLEWHRLCSYTEKSQRYQELMGDYVVPLEFEGAERALFGEAMQKQKDLYGRALKVLLEYFRDRHPEMLADKRQARVVEGYAREDARYALGLATMAQLGFTANARNLEYIIRRLRAHPLQEMRELGEEFYRLAGAVAPSLILLTDPGEYEREFGRPLVEDHFTLTHPHARSVTTELFKELGEGLAPESAQFPTRGGCKLLETSPDPDRSTLQAILHAHSGHPAETCRSMADRLLEEPEAARRLIREFLRYSNPWEAATREFETADFLFEVVLSAACYGQMKRHRMSTQLLQDYDPALGYTYPPSVIEAGLHDDFEAVYDSTSEAFNQLAEHHPQAAQYVLTNGHRRRMLLKANARELYHISRLREDAHAQWDIRLLSADLLALARERAPLTLMLAWGKDVFVAKKEALFG